MVDYVESSPVAAGSRDISPERVGGERKVDERDCCFGGGCGGGRRVVGAVLRWLDELRWNCYGFGLS